MKGRRIVAIISFIVLFMHIIFFPKEVAAYSVSASSAVLMEQQSGRVLYEHNPHEIRRIASITKVMTAIIAIESGKMNEDVKVSKKAIYTEGSSIYLQEGEKIKLKDLVYGLMLKSGNDAAVAIAEHVGGSVEGFVFLMNQKAEELGMANTTFANPHGLDDHENHYSTAYDMALMTRYAMNNQEFRDISGTKVYKFERESGPQQWKNKNRLLTEKYKYSTGGKTGFTKRAGRTLITTAKKNNMELIGVTLNAPDDWNDHITMYESSFQTYPLKTINKQGKLAIKVKNLDNKEFYLKKPILYPLTKDELSEIKVEYKLLHQNRLSELTEGKAGEAILYLNNEPVGKAPIFIKEIEKEKSEGWWRQLKTMLFSQDGVMVE